LHVPGQINPDRDNIFEFSKFQYHADIFETITPSASEFNFGAAMNLQAPTEVSSTKYSDEGAYPQYLQLVLTTTSNHRVC